MNDAIDGLSRLMHMTAAGERLHAIGGPLALLRESVGYARDALERIDGLDAAPLSEVEACLGSITANVQACFTALLESRAGRGDEAGADVIPLTPPNA